MTKGELPVTLNYIKLGIYIKTAKHFLRKRDYDKSVVFMDKVEHHLEAAVHTYKENKDETRI